MPSIPQTLLEDRRRRRSLALRIGWRKALGIGLLGIGVVLALLGGVRLVGQPEIPEGVSPQRAALIEALGPVRPFEGRLVGFEYAPVKPLPEGWRTDEVAEAIRAIDDEAEVRPSPRALADVGVVELLHGRFDRAVEILARADRRMPKDARIASDLAAAYLARGQAKQRPYDLILSLSVALRAVAAEPALQEAQFNFALGLEKFFLWAQARRRWENFIQTIPSEQAWIEEAQVRLNSLDGESEANWESQRRQLEQASLSGHAAVIREIVASYPQQARKYAEDILLPAWGEAWINNQAQEASRVLRVTRAIGEGLAAHSGDSMTVEAVTAIQQAAPSALASLAQGHLAFGAGVAHDTNQEPKIALQEFLKASALLNEGGSPFRAWAEVNAAICEYYLFLPESALQRLTSVELNLRNGHDSLRARLLWIKGLIKVRQADLTGALDAYSSSLGTFSRAGEAENAAALHFLVAECLRYQGEKNRAWWHRYQSLRLVRRSGASVRFHNALFDAAESALRQEEGRVALLFQAEMIDSPWALEKPIYRAEAHLRRSMTYQRLGQHELARRDLAEAARQIPRIKDESRRLPLEADWGMASSGLAMDENNPVRAVEQLSLPIAFHSSKGSLPRVPGLLHRRSRFHFAAGNYGQQETDLTEGIRISETIRRKVLESYLRISYFDLAQPLFDDMVDLLCQRGLQEEAFLYSERSRARTLLDMYDPEGRTVLGVQGVRKHLPAELFLVEYTVLKDRTLAWVLGHSFVELIEIDVGESGLARQVSEFRSLILSRAPESRLREAGRGLYDLLLSRALKDVPLDATVAIVPDKALYRLPFAALLTPNDRYLIEEKSLVFSPSATVLVRSSERTAQLSPIGKGGVLVVADPAIDRRANPSLPGLPGATLEAQKIVAAYGGGRTLLGRSARKDSFRRLAPSFGVIHLGVHGLINSEFPLLSALALASESTGNSGLLLAHEIYQAPLPRTRLVVLAACDSLGGGGWEGEGIMSLARAFLAAGVPAVVGGLWKLPDVETGEVLLPFHERVSGGMAPVEALREAQVRALRSKDTTLRAPASWAGFEVVGVGY